MCDPLLRISRSTGELQWNAELGACRVNISGGGVCGACDVPTVIWLDVAKKWDENNMSCEVYAASPNVFT
jgi:hypothetical protein